MELVINDKVTFVKNWCVGLFEIQAGTEGYFAGEHNGGALVTVDIHDLIPRKSSRKVDVWVPFSCIGKLGEAKRYHVPCVAEVLLDVIVDARTEEEAKYYAKELFVASGKALRNGLKEDDIFPLAVMSTEIKGVKE